MKNIVIPFFAVFIIIAFCSCGTNKKLTQQSIYFKNLNDSLLKEAVEAYEPVFQKGDMLSITISTANESSAKLLNPVNVAMAGAGDGVSGGAGYLVDNDGNITLPLLGSIKVEGLTKVQLNKELTQKIRNTVVNDAIVSIRLLNYKITVLGEVSRPSAYNIPNERVTILDAIGLAGDLTIYGRRDNIRIIREKEGKRELGFLDLNDGNIFQSPYFYLRQNDIVYVEMNERKMISEDQTTTRTFSLVLGVLSAISIITLIITRF